MRYCNSVGLKVGAPKWGKWTVPKLEAPLKMDGPTKSGQTSVQHHSEPRFYDHIKVVLCHLVEKPLSILRNLNKLPVRRLPSKGSK